MNWRKKIRQFPTYTTGMTKRPHFASGRWPRSWLAWLITAITLWVNTAAWAEATRPGQYYVAASHLNVRLSPSSNGPLAGRLPKAHKVDVYEIRAGWARLTEFYPSASLGRPAAQWVSAKFLAKSLTKPNV